MTGDYDLSLSDAPDIGIAHVGSERQPVVRIDGVMRDAHELVRFACDNGGFADDMAGLYPGSRAPLPLAYADSVVRRLDPLIRETFALGSVKLVKADCVYSLATSPPAALVPFQRIPHIDTTHPLHFAVLHFLCDERFGGTGFYRQRETGYETISADRERAWEIARNRQFARGSESPAAYIGDSNDWYERIALCEARFDRMLVYRSNALHSGHIPDPALLSGGPARGRLTANIFIGYRPIE
ncbi:DUF6445 family protein [Stakelama marina]|uniref:Uncharacterized protein n=1 Tax=Stakelama marina TaxID=2826939 RepID=A0A8T4IK24_9SPHN|nr:DUF6445 family protein [Stakelama marina]MBR0552536.1 hypothetical protein [Stakelama marina]